MLDIIKMRILKRISLLCFIFTGILAASRNSSSQTDIATLVSSHNAFAIDYYKVIGDEDINVFCSPYSLYSVMAMTAEGARTSTAAEFGSTLRFPEFLRTGRADKPWDLTLIHSTLSSLSGKMEFTNESEIRDIIDNLERAYMDSCVIPLPDENNKDSKRLYEQLLSREERAYNRLNAAKEALPRYELRLANSIWIQDSFPITNEYIDLIKSFYTGSGAFETDFCNPRVAEKSIRDWVSSKTKERIKLNVPVNCYTRLVLVNTMYFMGTWEKPFNERKTESRKFTLSTGETINTDIMKADDYYAAKYAAFNADGSYFQTPFQIFSDQREGLYPDAKGYSILELRYKQCGLAMVIIAPNSYDNLAAIEEILSLNSLESWIEELVFRKVNILMPKFEMEMEYNLKAPLISLGLLQAFDKEQADLSGIWPPTGDLRLYVSNVLQKTMIIVNEKGTEAAVATAARIEVTASQTSNRKIPFIPTFRADRPFIFMIRDINNGLILFMGKVTNPKKVVGN